MKPNSVQKRMVLNLVKNLSNYNIQHSTNKISVEQRHLEAYQMKAHIIGFDLIYLPTSLVNVYVQDDKSKSGIL